MRLIRDEQGKGKLVRDDRRRKPTSARGSPRPDVGVAMNTGTQAAKEAGNMVDLDSDPTKLLESWRWASSSS